MTVELIGEWPPRFQAAMSDLVKVLSRYKDMDWPEGAVNIKLVTDTEIAQLNEQHSGNAYATDVLTFTYDEEDSLDGELADIVISIETAAAQAKAAQLAPEHEVALLALHGILHAAGLDHQEEDSQEQMSHLQAAILNQAGIPYREFTWVD